MDPRRFDTLVRAFAAEGTRRRLVAALATLPFAGALAHGVDEAEAEKPRDRIKRRKDANRRRRRNRKHHKNKNKNKNNQNNGGGGKGGRKPDSCALPGQACQQHGDCCQGNCFNQVCADPPNQCGDTNCPAGSTGCCAVDGCCPSPTNQCNAGGLCCAPNCGGKQCGPDGCGNGGTCGACAPGQRCNLDTAQCEGPVCNRQSCPNGCCDRNGICQPGASSQQCGRGGIACFACGPNQYCSTETGACRDKPPCGPETCPNGCCVPQPDGPDICDTTKQGCTPGGACCAGCCDANDVCQPGTGDGECGLNGSACIICNPLDGLCDQGRCQCDAANCPNGCCSNGPGNPGLCFVDDPRFCGANGVTCTACPEGTACNAQEQCECTAQSCLASTGRRCRNNQCLCDAELCDGCCQDNVCKPGTTPDACGNGAGGGPCATCAPGDVCVDQNCCPAGTKVRCYGGQCCPPDSPFCCGFSEFCCPSDTIFCCGDSNCCGPIYNGCTADGVCCAPCAPGTSCLCRD